MNRLKKEVVICFLKYLDPWRKTLHKQGKQPRLRYQTTEPCPKENKITIYAIQTMKFCPSE